MSTNGSEGEAGAFKLMLWRGPGTLRDDDVRRVPRHGLLGGASGGGCVLGWARSVCRWERRRRGGWRRLDPRVKACMDVCCLTDLRGVNPAHGLKEHGIYYYVPSLLKHFQAADINELIVPRAHLSVNGERIR